MQTATKNNYELNDYIIQTSGEEIISLSHNPKRKKRTAYQHRFNFCKRKISFYRKKGDVILQLYGK